MNPQPYPTTAASCACRLLRPRTVRSGAGMDRRTVQRKRNQSSDCYMTSRGWLILMGVTERHVPVNARDILEKRITVIGRSRSTSHDFHDVLNLMKQPVCQETMRSLLPEQTTPVACVEDDTAATEQAAAAGNEKTVLEFHW